MSWPVVALGEVAEIQGGIQKQPKRAPQKNAFPFLRVANVMPHGLDLNEVHTIELFDGELERYRLRRGDLLVVEGNGSANQIGRAAIWNGSIKDAVHQNHLIRVRPGPELNERFLGHVWSSPEIRTELTRVASSTSGLHTLSVSKLRKIQVPLPPLTEQHRIVETLEDHLSRLDAAENLIARSAEQMAGLRGRLLLKLLHDTSHSRLRVGSLLRCKPANGKSVPTANDGFPVLRLTSLRGDKVDLRERKTGDWSADDAAKYLVRKGDVLLSRGNGSKHLVGRAGIVSDEPDPIAYPDTMIRLSPDSERLSSEYLVTVWNFVDARSQIERAARTTAGIYKINQSIVGDIEIPVPEIDDQLRIVQEVNEFDDSLRHLHSGIRVCQARSAALRRALLRAAFNGELVDQGPSDEPAA